MSKYLEKKNFGDPSFLLDSLKLNKPIPVDSRFMVSSLDVLDIEIPVKYRYPGLIFFVEEVELKVGTGNKETLGCYYCFETDVTKYKPLHDLSLRYVVHQVVCQPSKYSQLVNILNEKTYSIPGNIVDVKPLGIQVIFDGTTWKYFSGIYNISSDDVWNQIPDELKERNVLVLSNNVRKIVRVNKQLADEVEIVSNIGAMLDDNRYYISQDNLYYRIGGKAYRLTSKLYFNQISLVKGDNIIKHDLNASGLLVLCSLFDTVKGTSEKILVDVIFIDKNNINLRSEIDIKNILINISF